MKKLTIKKESQDIREDILDFIVFDEEVHEEVIDKIDKVEEVLDEIEYMIDPTHHEEDDLDDLIQYDNEEELEEEEEEEAILESLRTRLRNRKATRSILEGKGNLSKRTHVSGFKSLVETYKRSLESSKDYDLLGICPSCGSAELNSKVDTCLVCKSKYNTYRAVEAVEFDLSPEDNFTIIELDGEERILVDSDGNTSIEYPDEVDVSLAEGSHELVVPLEYGEDVVSIDTGEVMVDGSPVPVLVIHDMLEEVANVMTINNNELEVYETDLGYDIVAKVTTEDVVEDVEDVEDVEASLESYEDYIELAEEDEDEEDKEDLETLTIHLEEVEDGVLIRAEGTNNIEELIELVDQLLPEELVIGEVFDDEEVEEELAEEEEELEDSNEEEDDLLEDIPSTPTNESINLVLGEKKVKVRTSTEANRIEEVVDRVVYSSPVEVLTSIEGERLGVDKLREEEIDNFRTMLQEEGPSLVDYMSRDLEVAKHINLSFDIKRKTDDKLICITTIEADKVLTEDELDDIKEYLEGQFSDGLGESLEQLSIAIREVELEGYSEMMEIYLSLWNNRTFRFTTIMREIEGDRVLESNKLIKGIKRVKINGRYESLTMTTHQARAIKESKVRAL